MNPNPKVTIIIPVYNGANYLAEAINSALVQTYTNSEVLVINDGSTDNGLTEEIALSYGNRIRYISKENGGVSSALNRGIQEATGEWLSWLSHDDVYPPHKIERQIAYLKENPLAKVIASNVQIINQFGNIIGENVNSSYPVVTNGWEALHVLIYGCSLLIHKSCFDKVGFFNISNKTTQDDEMWLRLLRHYPIFFIPEFLCKWRQHPQSGTVTLSRQHLKDKYSYFKWILNEFDISWFFPPNLDPEKVHIKRLRACTYSWLGDYAFSLGTDDAAKLCYQYAMRAYPMITNPAFLKLCIGVDNLKRLERFLVGHVPRIRRFSPWLIRLYKSSKR